MKHISILITHQALIAAIGNTHYIFSMVNDFLEESGKEKQFDLNLVGLSKEMELNDGLYTSGGANSYWNLLVYLVEKFTNHAMAIRMSKYFEVEMDRVSQSQFMIFKGIKTHSDKRVQQAQEYIETHYQDKLTIGKLAKRSHLARRTFERRFKKATHYSVGEYMQRVRVEAAKKELESGQKTIGEVKYEAGYKDSTAFREVFKKFSGLTPVEYREKYNKKATLI